MRDEFLNAREMADRQITKLFARPAIDKDQAIMQLNNLQDSIIRTPELHMIADNILLTMLCSLGHQEVAVAYLEARAKIDFWYS